MYLSKLRVQGFRCFDNEFSVTFNSGLNVIVGENGAGKTAAISAIRQLFSDSEAGRYSINDDDFYSSFSGELNITPHFSISADFCELSQKEKVAFCSGMI